MKSAAMLTASAVAIFLMGSGALAPAKAQFAGGGGMEQMEQFAPMLETMKRHMGKKRFARLMQTVGPMMSDMMEGQGAGGLGGYGSGSFDNFDVGRMARMVDGRMIAGMIEAFDDGGGRRARRKRR